jgi:uncharacterized membrane protein
MTLLVLELRTPAVDAIHSESDLQHALLKLSPHFEVYLTSFTTLAIFWVGQQTLLEHLERSDRVVTWLNLAALFSVSLMPFSTALVAEFIEYRTAVVIYWLNLVLFGALLYACEGYAGKAGLLKPEATPEVRRAMQRRVQIGQALYAVGMLLFIVNTYWSIAFILLVQLNFVIAPSLREIRA